MCPGQRVVRCGFAVMQGCKIWQHDSVQVEAHHTAEYCWHCVGAEHWLVYDIIHM